jgi:flagellar hook-basal body complex protein FliE
MAVSGVGGGLSQLAELYRQQVSGGAAGGGATSTVGSVGGGSAAQQAQSTRGADFGNALGDGLKALESADKNASTKAIQASTGDLRDVHDYVIAATQAQVQTELTTTVRNKALDAFNEIMRMPL